MSFDINSVKSQLSLLTQESKDIKPNEGLERLGYIAKQILIYTNLEETESIQIQEILRHVEALDEKFRLNYKPYFFPVSQNKGTH